MNLSDLVFAGFNSRVAALHRATGEIVWSWKAPEGSGYVTLLLDGDLLIASVNGYMYALDPLTGQMLWMNKMSGFGFGVTSLTSVNGTAPAVGLAAAEEDEEASRLRQRG